jgi:hypothetical protein
MPLFNGDIFINVRCHPGYRSGKYYLHSPYIGTSATNSNGTATDTLIYIPFCVAQSITIDRIAFRIGADTTGSKIRAGLYSANNGQPGNLIVDVGEIDTSVSGTVQATLNITLSAGWYFLAINTNNPPSLVTMGNAYGTYFLIGQTSPSTASGAYSYQQSSVTYGALPSNAPVSNLSPRSNSPIFWFRVV